MDKFFIARILYSEASDICSQLERTYIAFVIINRINHIGFGGGKLTTPLQVVLQKNAFSCVGDERNLNWANSKFYSESTDNKAWQHALSLTRLLDDSKFKSRAKDTEVVYYHDHSISKPKSWDNKWWRTELIVDTEHFKFYSVSENK